MNPEELYRQRTASFKNKADLLQKRENRLSMARLFSFLSGMLLFFILVSITVAGAVIALLAGFIVFGLLVKKFAKTEKEKNFCRVLETINSREAQCLQGSYFQYADGSEYINTAHPYSYDLDIFGHASLFQYINRTTSKPAANMLADWLKTPAGNEEINLRQQAVIELKPMIDWRQKLITLGYENNSAGNDPQELIRWFESENQFIHHRSLKPVTILLSGLSLITAILAIIGLPAFPLTIMLIINFLYYFSQGKKISGLQNQVGRSAEMLHAYASTIRMIENRKFDSIKLKKLQNIFSGSPVVSSEIKLLAKYVSRLDARLNVMVAIPLNAFFFWDIHCCIALEKWKTRHASEINGWLAAMAEFEVLSGFSNMAFNNPTWTVPLVVPEYFVLNATGAGHPLIPACRRVNSTIEIKQSGKAIIVTGSNMSGKSTFLRTCGVNTILALAGAPVCADSFKISHVHVFSSMRISDSLEDNTSSFYAELKKLAAIIKESEHNNRVFLLLDEILRGTNSNDRYTGSVALIKQLLGYETVTIIATHDLKLADLAMELPEKIDNYHFDVKIDGEELYFDYKLTTGICKSLNASILMKKMGIKI